MKEFFSGLSPHGAVGAAFVVGVVGGVIYVLLEVYVLRRIEPMIGIQPAVAL